MRIIFLGTNGWYDTDTGNTVCILLESKDYVYKHEGLWQCMDTARDLKYLETLWETGSAPWKTW